MYSMNNRYNSMNVGSILEIKDNLISVSGLRGALSGELVYFCEYKSALSGRIREVRDDVCYILVNDDCARRLSVGNLVYLRIRYTLYFFLVQLVLLMLFLPI